VESVPYASNEENSTLSLGRLATLFGGILKTVEISVEYETDVVRAEYRTDETSAYVYYATCSSNAVPLAEEMAVNRI